MPNLLSRSLPLSSLPLGSLPLASLVFLMLLVLAPASLLAQPEAAAQMRSAVDYSAVTEALSDEIRTAMRKERVPGMVVILLDGDEVVWRQGFGEVERRSKRNITPEMRTLGSDFTKVITALAVLRLMEAGKLALDQPVTDFADIELVAMRPDFNVPTVRQLLAHQSGLPLNHTANMFQDEPGSHAQSWQAIQPLRLGQPSGRWYNYSNLGYVVLGELVAQVHGDTWERSVSDLVLAPLVMAESIVAASPDAMIIGHEERRPQAHWWPRDNAALGLHFSVDEIARVAQLILNRGQVGSVQLLSPESIDLMLSPQRPAAPLDLDNRYGFAWQLTNTVSPDVERIARVTLSQSYLRGGVLLAPDDRLGVVLLANSDESGEVARALTSQALNRMLEAKSGIPMPEEDDEPPIRVDLPASAQADSMAPAYAGPLGLMRFDGEPLHYRIDFYGRTFHANLRTDGWYRIRYRLLGFVPLSFGILDKLLLRPVVLDGRRVLLVSFRSSHFLAGIEYQPEGVSELWQARLGEYEIRNPDRITELAEVEEVRLVERDGFLLAEWRLPQFFKLEMSIPLSPINDDQLLTVGIGTGLGLPATFSQTDQGLEVEVSGYRFLRSEN